MWEHLHWLDSYNVGGFYVDAESTATALTASGVDGGGSGFDEEDGNAWLKKFSEEQLAVTKKEMTWNISLYLPPACRKEFNAFVSDYLDMILTFADDFEDQENNGFGGGGGVNSIQLNKSYLSKKTEYLQKSIKHSLKRRLLEVIPNIHRKWLSVKDNEEVDETLRNKYLFPKLPGSHLDLQNPALELVKYLCTVIGLDKELEWEVGILKKDLLLMIGIKQFSGMAKYENPCERCIMSVICSYCGKTKELDLTRDPDVEAAALEEAAAAAAAAASREGGGEGMQDEEQMAAAAAAAARAMRRKTSWRCDLCTTEYDRSMIEHHMINAVQKYVQQWYLQDLQCKRCKGVNMYSIREHCYCSGFLEPELKSDEFATRIRIFKNVAEYYGLDHLKEVVAAHSNVF